jgi:hypothetical protein
MASRGKLIRKALPIVLVASIASGTFALSAAAAPHPQAAAKKCKKKKTVYSKKRRCKKRRAALPASISISPASQDFGVPQIGGEDRTFTVTNVGGSPSGVPIPALSQAGADFSIAANGCIAPLSAAASCSIEIHVATNGAGQVSATITVTAIPGGVVAASMTADIQA